MSAADPADHVWLRAHVEPMHETTAYLAIPRDEWDAMTSDEQGVTIDGFGAEVVGSAGGWGCSVVDVSELPDEDQTEVLGRG